MLRIFVVVISMLQHYGEGCNIPPTIANMTPYRVHTRRPFYYQDYIRGPYPLGTYIQYFCKSGFYLRGQRLRCTSRGWIGETPTCVKKCQDEPPSNSRMAGYKVYQGALVFGQRFRDYHKPYDEGSTVEYVCDFKYMPEVQMPSNVQCTNGSWSGSVPRCVDAEFATCGQPGEIENNITLANLHRMDGSEPAARHAWPWQVLITKRSTSINTSLSDENVKGGGSIINNKWILTAAHVLLCVRMQFWCSNNELLAFVGISKRPGKDGVMQSTIEGYAIEKYVKHNGFNLQGLDNDIALIKVGVRLYPYGGVNSGLTLRNHIRPVCLPWTGGRLKKERLVDINRSSTLTGRISDNDMHQVEEFLLNSSARAVVTGFGHKNRTPVLHYKLMPAKTLQQGLLKIEDKATCRNGAKRLKALLGGIARNLQFAENMICCSSGINGTNTDSCYGDGGGPLMQWLERPVVKGNIKIKQFNWVQIGIVSFGYGCGTGFPGYYTNIARHLTWINDAANGTFQDKLKRHILDCGDGFSYKGRCYFTEMKSHYQSNYESPCISNGGGSRLADILDINHQKLVDADVRGKMLIEDAIIKTAMIYQSSARTVRLTNGSEIGASSFQWVEGFPDGNDVNIELWVRENKFHEDNGLVNYMNPGGHGALCTK